jgi:hypothetical protein
MFSFFGITSNLEITDKRYSKKLINELDCYITTEKKATILITDDWTSFDKKIVAINPSIHLFGPDVIYIKNKLLNVAFVFNKERKLTTVFFKLNYEKNRFKRVLRKWLNMQFTNRIENIGQIFHELVLVPLTFFQDNLVPIHAAGFSNNDNSGVLLGGTGGVGKTTIEIDFCLKNKMSFLTDDIAIGDVKGQIFPNYNWPKIYGYNLIGNKPLKKILSKTKNTLSSFHWFLHKHIFGINKVRRKISPFILYDKVVLNSVQLGYYFILNKKDCEAICFTELDINKAVKMSVDIIVSEYSEFFNHISWHEFNALSNNLNPIITKYDLIKKWTHNLTQLLSNKRTLLLNIPLNITHDRFKTEVEDLIYHEIIKEYK